MRGKCLETTDGQSLGASGRTDQSDVAGRQLEGGEINTSLADPSRLRKTTVGADAIHGAGILTHTSGRVVACRASSLFDKDRKIHRKTHDMILNELDARRESVMQVARMMMTAARTAPKAKGVDIQEIVAVDGDDLPRLAAKMRELSEELQLKFLLRDADNVELSHAVVLVGTRQHTQGLDCRYCGFNTCGQKSEWEAVPCYFNAVDVGIALGSAVSLAADLRVDTRIMYSAGVAARRLGLIENCAGVIAILLSCSSKSPFFDRVTPESAK